MMKSLLHRFLSPQPAASAPPDTRHAFAALLVRIARSDGLYAVEEVEKIDEILMRNFKLDPFEAARLRSEAESMEASATDTIRFTRALKETTPLEARVALMQALWSIAIADGFRDDEEDQEMRLVASLLGLTDVESALARQQATRQ